MKWSAAPLRRPRPQLKPASTYWKSICPQKRLLIRGDLHRLTQILTNVLNNAARYTPAGGRITVTAQADDGHAVLRVRDNGRGIDTKFIPRIFDMFVQGQRSNGRRGARHRSCAFAQAR